MTTLKFRLTVSVIAALAIGVVVVASMLMRQAETDTLASERRQQVNQSVRTAAVLSRRVIDLQRGLLAAAARLDRWTMADGHRLDHFVESNAVLGEMFSGIFVVATDGRMLVLNRDGALTHPTTSLANREYIQRALKEERVVISEPVTGRITGEPIIAFACPLRDEHGVYGVLGGSIGLASRDLLADLVEDDDSGSLLIVADRHGHILAHPRPAALLASIASQTRLAEAFRAWVATGSPVEPTGLSLPQREEIVSVSGVAGTDWVVWRAASENDLLAALRAARRNAFFLCAALLAAMSLVMLLLLAWLLRPLAKLGQRAQHLFDGTDPHEGWPAASGEIGRLAQVLRHVGAERAQLEAFNDEVLKKLASVMSAAPIGIAFTRARRFELVSAELCQILGHSEERLLGQPVEMLYADPAHYLAALEQITPAFEQGQPYVGELQMLRADGRSFWAQLRGRPVDRLKPDAGAIWTLHDISDQVAARLRLEWSASHDGLTGLANRTVFQRRLQQAFEARDSRPSASVIVIDLDYFKPINDAAGHAAGDAMLKAVAAEISRQVRAGDLVVRTGGDEFALLLECCPPATGLCIADDIHRAIVGITLPWQDEVLRVGASLGVAALSAETESVDSWLAEADAACYQVKRAGRGAVLAASPARLTLVAANKDPAGTDHDHPGIDPALASR